MSAEELPEWVSTVVFRAQQDVTVRAATEKEARTKVEELIGRGPMMMGVERKPAVAAVAKVPLSKLFDAFVQDSESVAVMESENGFQGLVLLEGDPRSVTWQRSKLALVERIEALIVEVDRHAIRGSTLAGAVDELRGLASLVKGKSR